MYCFFQGQGLTPVLIGPAIEEACKPIGVLLILAWRPHWFRSGFEVVLMAALGALVFATLENLVYVHLYHPEGGPDFVLFRYTVCTALHLSATGIFGLGLSRLWHRIRHDGIGFDIDMCFWYFVAATALHAVYNTTVIILHFAKVLRF